MMEKATATVLWVYRSQKVKVIVVRSVYLSLSVCWRRKGLIVLYQIEKKREMLNLEQVAKKEDKKANGKARVIQQQLTGLLWEKEIFRTQNISELSHHSFRMEFLFVIW